MKEKILIVDDEHVVCDAIARQLRDVGYHVVVAYSGMSAIEIIKEQDFDVALIDIRMPKINGFGVLRELREKSAKTKAIMMTAYADIRSAVDSITLGAIDIISKPVDVDEVIMTISRCLNR
jgi:DNA-binding NtrC family response regulator